MKVHKQCEDLPARNDCRIFLCDNESEIHVRNVTPFDLGGNAGAQRTCQIWGREGGGDRRDKPVLADNWNPLIDPAPVKEHVTALL